MKKALIVGINYVGTFSRLRGCVNDARNMQKLLQETYKFDEIKLLLEQEATTIGILEGLNWLTSSASANDTLVFFYSGHGSQLPSLIEPDGYEEIICPVDINWRDKVITDKMLHDIFNKLQNDINITLILDCCNSGDALNQVEKLEPAVEVFPVLIKPWMNLPKFLPPPKEIEAQRPVQWSVSRDVNVSAILIAACRSDQLSVDAYIDGIYQGASTAAMIKACTKDPEVSYEGLVSSMTTYMLDNAFYQRPQLEGFRSLYSKPFLSSFRIS